MNEIFFELFSDLPRQGPGDNEFTRQALSYFQLPEKPRILDIGCGTGMQTLELARLTAGDINAVDNHAPYIKELQTKADQHDYRIRTQVADMTDIEFADNTFDLLWAEGSIYIIGIEKALQNWKRMLVPGGGIAFSEITWLDENPPQQIYDYWKTIYPAMQTAEQNKKILEQNGFELLDIFVLPEFAWWKHYYNHLEKRLLMMKQKYIDMPEATIVFEETRKEMDMYRQYSAWYGYVFYMAFKK